MYADTQHTQMEQQKAFAGKHIYTPENYDGKREYKSKKATHHAIHARHVPLGYVTIKHYLIIEHAGHVIYTRNVPLGYVTIERNCTHEHAAHVYVRIRYKHSIICTVAPTRTYSHTLAQSHPHALILYTIKHLVTETAAGEGDAHQRPVQVQCVCQDLIRILSMHATLMYVRHKCAQTYLATNVKKTSIKTNKQTNN